eukprot:366197-Chlamydomonas_euryale.AAC.25
MALIASGPYHCHTSAGMRLRDRIPGKNGFPAVEFEGGFSAQGRAVQRRGTQRSPGVAGGRRVKSDSIPVVVC